MLIRLCKAIKIACNQIEYAEFMRKYWPLKRYSELDRSDAYSFNEFLRETPPLWSPEPKFLERLKNTFAGLPFVEKDRKMRNKYKGAYVNGLVPKIAPYKEQERVYVDVPSNTPEYQKYADQILEESRIKNKRLINE